MSDPGPTDTTHVLPTRVDTDLHLLLEPRMPVSSGCVVAVL